MLGSAVMVHVESFDWVSLQFDKFCMFYSTEPQFAELQARKSVLKFSHWSYLLQDGLPMEYHVPY